MRCSVKRWQRISGFLLTTIVITLSGNIFGSGVMRTISSMDIVKDMKLGWSLGNTLDAYGNWVTGLETETMWGNPKTTKAMFTTLKVKGFKTVRVPVTWRNHFSESSPYTIDKAWLDRVQEVVNYGIDNGMYVILNSHHDEWVTLTTSSQATVTDKITKIWAQIADRFKDYSDYLVFETLNEPRLYGAPEEWNGGTPAARQVLNAYNLAIVNTIRNSGGNNAQRHIMIPTHAATPLAVAQNDLVIPNNDTKIIVSQHTYWPYEFTMDDPGTDSWGTVQDQKECDDELDRIYNKFVKNGIPVIVGEWGAIDKSNTPARAAHAEYYTEGARKRGMLPIWWDNGDPKRGGFALLNRSQGSWYFPEIVDALIKGADTNIQKEKKNTLENSPIHVEVFSGYVKYSLTTADNVSIRIYTIHGRNVFESLPKMHTAGDYTIVIPTTILSNGSYIINFESNAYSVVKSFTMIK